MQSTCFLNISVLLMLCDIYQGRYKHWLQSTNNTVCLSVTMPHSVSDSFTLLSHTDHQPAIQCVPVWSVRQTGLSSLSAGLHQRLLSDDHDTQDNIQNMLNCQQSAKHVLMSQVWVALCILVYDNSWHSVQARSRYWPWSYTWDTWAQQYTGLHPDTFTIISPSHHQQYQLTTSFFSSHLLHHT